MIHTMDSEYPLSIGPKSSEDMK